MTIRLRLLHSLLALWLVPLIPSTVQAGGLLPNGNPVSQNNSNAHPSYAISSNSFQVQLGPNPASFRPQGNCSWLLPALAVQGFAKVDPQSPTGYSGANGWTIAFATLKGSLTLVDYEAWADQQPNISLNGKSPSADKLPGDGGAGFVLNYESAAAARANGDPDPASLKWIQVLHDNDPIDFEKDNGKNVGGGYYISLDDAPKGGGKPADPYYGHLSDFAFANGSGFLDRVTRDLKAGIDWQAQAFVATATGKNLTIYDGVWWGFQTAAVPEPSTLVQGLGASVVLTLLGLWRRGAARRIAL
jgi:hypothetical protein